MMLMRGDSHLGGGGGKFRIRAPYGFPTYVNSYAFSRFMSGTDQYAQKCFSIFFPAAEWFFWKSFKAQQKQLMHKVKLERAYTKS